MSEKNEESGSAAGGATAGVSAGRLALRAAAPGYTVNDLEKSRVWYRDVMGCTEGEKWEMDGKLMGIEMKAGSVLIMLGQDDWQKGRDRVKGEGIRIFYTTTDDIDELAARIKAAGGTLTKEPTDQPWGMRDISLEDPDGYKLTIGAELKKGKSEE